jgi:ribonuclease P protein component
MMFAPSSELVNPRVAFAIGRQFGNAVNRNRVRRQAKAILRELELDLPTGRFLVGAKPTSKTSSFIELREDLQSLIYRARQAL